VDSLRIAKPLDEVLALGLRASAVNQFFNDVCILFKLDLIGNGEVRPKVRDMDFILYKTVFQVT
jgi:hypothetical protein